MSVVTLQAGRLCVAEAFFRFERPGTDTNGSELS